MFGYERLLDLVAMAAAMPADAIADTLFAAVDEFGVGRPQDDDQTLVVIKGAAA
jgi:sigma-B regulation protein RsbU (phosphoserine phosphatase)